MNRKKDEARVVRTAKSELEAARKFVVMAAPLGGLRAEIAQNMF